MEGLIEKVLREFKASVESRPRGTQGAVRMGSEKLGPGTVMTDLPKTGTYGDDARRAETRLGSTAKPVDYTIPPEVKR